MNLHRFNYFMLVAKLQLAGFISSEGKKHNTEIWYNPETGNEFIITKQSGHYSKEVLLGIIAKTGLTLEQFQEL